MVYKARLLLSGRQKLAMMLLALLVIGFFAYYPRITEAILAFLLGGEVPGTDVILSPDTVLVIIGILFVATMVTIGLRLHHGRVRRNHTFVQIPVKTVSKVAIPVITEVAEDVPMTAPRGDGSLHRRHRLAAAWGVVADRVGHGLQIFGIASMKVIRKLRAASIAGGRVTEGLFSAVISGVRISLKVLALVVATVVKLTVRLTRAVWQLAKPQLQNLDAWLEIQVRKVEAKAAKKLNSHETVRAVTAMGREYRKSIHELSPRAVFHGARIKAAHIKTKVSASPER